MLVVFYYSTGGDQWKISDNWLDANDHSKWYGVTTDSSNYVKTLNLQTNAVGEWISGNALNGTIPAEIGDLTSLTELWLLRNNDLSGPIPAEIGNLTSLTELVLTSNDLSGPIPAEIGNLTSLTGLFLNGNALTGSIPEGVCNLPSAYFSADCDNCNQSTTGCCDNKCSP